LANAPVVGPWVAARWRSDLAQPGALLMLTQRMDPTADPRLCAVAGAVHDPARAHRRIHDPPAGFLFQEGASIAHDVTRALQLGIGDRAQRYVDVATRAVRAAVSSMLVVGLFDAVATACAYAIAGVPRAMVWAAITGALAAVPFLGYVAVAAMAMELVVNGAPTPGTVVARAGMRRPAVRRQGRAAHGGARRHPPAVRPGC
jgi:hypothetical protein